MRHRNILGRGPFAAGGVLSFVALALLCSCAAPPDDGVTSDESDAPVGDLGGQLGDSGTVGAVDVGSSSGSVDTGAAADIAKDCPGGPFCPCTAHEECDTSMCISTPDGNVCAKTCIEACPDGYKCALVNSPGGDTVNICVAKWGRLCDPCSTDKDCASLGNDEAACIDRGPLGGFCSIPCSKGECPLGYACKPTFTFEGVKADRCVPEKDGAEAECTCSQNASSKKLKTKCYIEVKDDGGKVVGQCGGERSCGDSGLSACQAPPAEAEKCDGEDNDCDGQTDEATCDDKNPCTADICDPKKTLEGKDGCTHNVTEAPCDADGNDCTENDKCTDGLCKPGPAKNCNDSNPCTKDECLPASGCTQTDDDGAPCDDDNPCTQSDLCKLGGCEPGIAKKCKSGDPCVLAACDISSGKCAFKPIPDGVPCNDGTACTKSDSCLGGTCLGKVVDCDDGNKCTDDSCDAKTGCQQSPNGNACNDADACTDNDTCKGGKCGGTAKVIAEDCNDGNPCTKDGCDAKKGCTHEDQKGDCSDGNPCTKDDSCKDGQCVGGASSCQCQSNKDCNPFEDGDLCNGTLVCDKSAVPFSCKVDKNTVVTCSSKNDTTCLANKCDKTKGACQLVPNADGKPCDADNDVCSVGDKCSKGTCLAGPQQSCDDKNPCTTDSCHAKDGCQHAAAAGKCSDGDECTEGDGCSNKVCLSGKKKVCDDGVACTTDSCDKATGKCVFTGIPGCGGFCATSKDCDDNKACTTDLCVQGKCLISNNNKACDDNNKCTKNDACKDGACNGVKADCDDGNECTTDSCKAGIGCINQGHNLACEDGNQCTSGDQCTVGACKPGKQKVCDDGDKCTNDACDPKTGKCGSTPVFGCGGYCKDASHCNDKNVCTDDVCTDGKCEHKSNTKPCDDGDGCTTGDTCKSGACKGGEGVEVKTVAGSGKAGYKDDNPKIAEFKNPSGVAVHAGNVYVADLNNHAIRRVGADGLVTTLAGSGSAGSKDGYGKLAAFNRPQGVSTDLGGNVFVADTYNHRIRRVTPQGAVVTLAGSGKAGHSDAGSSDAQFYYPRGVAATPLGAVFVADSNNHRIRQVSPSGKVTTLAGSGKAESVDGSGTKAGVQWPVAIALAANGDLFFTELSPSSRVRKLTQSGVVTTIAGKGDGVFDGVGTTARFNNPRGIAVSSSGALFIGDDSNHRIRKISPTGFVSTLIGFAGSGYVDGGPGVAKLHQPRGVALDGQGRLYLASYHNHRIRVVVDSTANCNIGGKCYSSGLRKPGAPCFVCNPNQSKTAWSKLAEGSACQDGSYCTIDEKCNVQGGCSGKSKSCDDANPCTADSCEAATGACQHVKTVGQCGFCTTDGHCDDGNACTNDACVANSCQHTFNTKPCKSGNACSTGETCSQGKCLAEAAIGTTTIAGTGKSGNTDGSANQATFNRPTRVAVGPKGAIFVADRYNHRIRRISADFKTVTTFAGGSSGYQDGLGVQARFNDPSGISVAPDGTVYVADRDNHRIRTISKDGAVSTLSGSGNAGYVNGTASASRFYYPTDVAATAAGSVFVADQTNHKIRKVDSDGNSSLIAGGSSGYVDGKGSAARFSNPQGLDLDTHGRVYVADSSNHRIRRIAQDGTVTTIAGAGIGLLDGAVNKALFRVPTDVAVDPAGRVWVADSDNHRIRRFVPGGTVSSVAGSSYGFADGIGPKALFRSPNGIAASNTGAIFVADYNNHAVRRIFDGGNSCAIGGACFADQVPNPGAPCQRCEALKSATGWTAIGAGQPCDDGKPCVSSEMCDDKGACSGKATVCDDGDKCTIDSCEAGTGLCVFKKKLSHDCYCTNTSHCDDSNVCTDATCQSGKCVKTFNNKPCKSGEACSAGDTCSFGSCVALHSVEAGWTCGKGYSSSFVEGDCKVATFNYPQHSALAADGTIYVADHGRHRIRRISKGIVQTIAGQGSAGYVDGIGSVARFRSPVGIGIDALGNLVVADYSNNTIRKVTKTGLVSSLSGNGQAGYANGPATLARFSQPTGLHVTGGGDVYVLDQGNRRIRHVQPDGTTSTIAGSGSHGYSDGPVASASFRNMKGITMDTQGNLYITQHGPSRIRRIGTNGVVTTIAGQGGDGYADGDVKIAKLNAPNGIAVDALGNLFFADGSNNRIRKISGGKVSTLAGSSGGYTNGTGPLARFNHPLGLVLHPDGKLLVTDYYNHRLRWVWDSKDNCEVAGACWGKGFSPASAPCNTCDPATNAKAFVPRKAGAVCDDGKTCTSSACDAKQKCIATPVNCDDNNPCTADSCTAWGLCQHKQTNTCDDGDPCTLGETCVSGKCKPEIDRWVTQACGAGYSNSSTDGPCSSARFNYPVRIRQTTDGRRWVFDSSSRLREWTAKDEMKNFAGGASGFKNGYTNQAQFNLPRDIVQLSNKELIVTDYNNNRLRKIDANDYVSVHSGSVAGFKNGALSAAQYSRPLSLALAKGDVMYVSDYNNRAIRKVAGGQVSTFTGGNGYGFADGPKSKAKFRYVTDIALDGAGNLWIADSNNYRIRKASPDGTVTTVAGGSSGFADGTGSAARFANPNSIALGADGLVYISDANNHRIRVMTQQGVVTTHAGSGNSGHANGTGSSARFNYPYGLLITATGDLFVADHYNHRLRKVVHSLGRCYVGKQCYGPGIGNPSNACQVCDAAKSKAAFSDRAEGADCDDGAPCTTGDKCASGTCKGTAKSCASGCEVGSGACK